MDGFPVLYQLSQFVSRRIGFPVLSVGALVLRWVCGCPEVLAAAISTQPYVLIGDLSILGCFAYAILLSQVTLTQAIYRRFPWKKVPIYWAAQLFGAFIGALLTYALYRNAIDQFEGVGVRTVPGTAGLFGTFPLDYVTDGRLHISRPGQCRASINSIAPAPQS